MTKQPSYRFAGYTEPWEEKKLGEVLVALNDIVSGESGLPIATSSRQGLFLQKEYFSGDRAGIDQSLDFHRVPVGYVTYRHMSDDSIFKFNKNNFDTDVLVSKEYPVFTVNDKANLDFILFHLNSSSRFLKFSILQKLGGTRVRLYYKNLSNYQFSLPSVPEQTAIGSLFQDIDQLISLQQRKLEVLKEQKKTYLKLLFPAKGQKKPVLRFAGFEDEWKEKYLYEVLKVSKDRNVDLAYDKNQVLSVSREAGVVNQIEYQGRSFAGADLSNYKIVNKENLIYTKSPLKGAPYGIFQISYTTGIVSPLYAVFKSTKQIFAPFVGLSLMDDNKASKYLSPIVTKGAKNTINITDEGSLQGKLLFPSMEEQRIIHTFFQDLDKSIAKQEEKVNQLKESKQTLLRKMFI